MTGSKELCVWQMVPIDAPKPSAKWIAAMVLVALGQQGFYQKETAPEIEDAVMMNWIRALSPIPEAALQRSFDEWVDTKTKAPTIAHIRLRALEFVVSPASLVSDGATFPPVVVDADELTRRRADKFQDEMRRIFPKLKQITKCEGDGC